MLIRNFNFQIKGVVDNIQLELDQPLGLKK